ncbi:MAG: DUF3667 domain-containing protein, partial [Pseudomonadota bacterium]
HSLCAPLALMPSSLWGSTALALSECANCGAQLTGPYCNQCGQKANVHRTLTAIGHDLMHGVLHLDGKLAHTLPLLAFKPGKLTRRFIEGERAKFVSPMAMFLFSVFAMFAVFQMIGIGVPTDLGELVDDEAVAELQVENATLNARKATLEQLIAAASTAEAKELLENRLRLVENELAALELANAVAGVESEVEADGAQKSGDPREPSFSAKLDTSPGLFHISDKSAPDFLKKLAEKWNKNPGLMLYKMQANGYKFSWLLIPLSLPFVWLLFAWRRGVMAYDHTVFITYSLSFMSLFFIALSLLNIAGLSIGWTMTLFATLAPLHLYKHLRHSYGLSRFSAIWRFLMLMLFILIVSSLFLQALLLLGGF